MKVREIMHSRAVSIGPGEPVIAAVLLMKRYNLGALPVCEGGRVKGMVTDRDILLRCVGAGMDLKATRVSEIMSRAVVSADAEDSAEHAAALMAARQLRRLPVTENGRLAGMVGLGDLARREDCRALCAQTLGRISANISRAGPGDFPG